MFNLGSGAILPPGETKAGDPKKKSLVGSRSPKHGGTGGQGLGEGCVRGGQSDVGGEKHLCGQLHGGETKKKNRSGRGAGKVRKQKKRDQAQTNRGTWHVDTPKNRRDPAATPQLQAFTKRGGDRKSPPSRDQAGRRELCDAANPRCGPRVDVTTKRGAGRGPSEKSWTLVGQGRGFPAGKNGTSVLTSRQNGSGARCAAGCPERMTELGNLGPPFRVGF